jgi:hypothetical protein
MTTTDKKVTRLTVDSYSVLWPKAKQVVVTLCHDAKGDWLVFRHKGEKSRFQCSVESCFVAAVKRQAFIEAVNKPGAVRKREKARERAARIRRRNK